MIFTARQDLNDCLLGWDILGIALKAENDNAGREGTPCS